MLKKIRLVNFQCHQETEIELEPVTVLVGDNARGKSAIVRGLRWLALNEWNGKADTFIHWHGDDAQVDAYFENNLITRLKGKQGNFYLVNGEVLEADLSMRRSKVPIQVQQITGLTDDNFQEQLDPAFWFSLTAGQVAKSLNKIVNLCSIDSTLANAGEEVRLAKTQLREASDRLAEARNIKKSLDWTIQADKDLKALEEKTAKAGEIRSRLTGLARWRLLLTSLSRREKHAADVILRGQTAIDKMGKIGEIRNKLTSIEAGLGRIEYAQGRIKWLQAQLKEKEPRLKAAQAGTCPLCLK